MTGDQNRTGGGGSKGRPHRSLSGEPGYSSLVLKLLPWSASTQFASTPSRKALGACPLTAELATRDFFQNVPSCSLLCGQVLFPV